MLCNLGPCAFVLLFSPVKYVNLARAVGQPEDLLHGLQAGLQVWRPVIVTTVLSVSFECRVSTTE